MSWGDEISLPLMVDASLKSLMPLFVFYQYPPFAPVLAFNTNLVANAENIEVYPEVKSACDYIQQANPEQEMLNLAINSDGRCETLSIGSMQFSVVNSSIEVGDKTIQLKHLACIKNNYAISIIQSFVGDPDLAMLNSMLKTLTVKCRI
jgi:hypothetical protein